MFQSFGGIGRQGLAFFSDLMNRPACRRVVEPKKFVWGLREGLGCALMRSNVRMVLRWLQLVLPAEHEGVA